MVKLGLNLASTGMERLTCWLSSDECVQITTLREEGYGYSEFSSSHNLSLVMQQYPKTQGKPWATTSIEDRFHHLWDLKDSHEIARHLYMLLQELHGTRGSDNTVLWRLAEQDFRHRGRLKDHDIQENIDGRE